MRNLSKSKLIAFRQCPKRLWLEIHRPDLREDSAATQASFQVGNKVGDLARLEAAKAVAPYIHPRLRTTEISSKGGKQLAIESIPMDMQEATKIYRSLMDG